MRVLKPEMIEKIKDIIERESAEAHHKDWTEFLLSVKVPPFNYRFDHVIEVVSIAQYIAKETSADLEVVTLAAWLHDIDKPTTIGGEGTHHETGAVRAHKFLTEEGVDKRTIERVCDAIRKHMTDTFNLKEPLEPLEAQIIWEADRLTKIGVTCAVRDIINGVRYRPNNSVQGNLQTLIEYLPRQRNIVSSIFTKPGRRIANQKIQHLEQFITNLDRELTLTLDH